MVLGKQLGGLFLAGAVSFLIACGADLPPQHNSNPPPPPPPLVTLGLDHTSYLVGLEESVTAVAIVSGTETPVTWTLNCETGQASMVPSGSSATLTAHAGGMCFLWATEGQLSALAIVRIPPLSVGDSCTDDSQCGQGAPICGLASGDCSRTCTMRCATDADCPIRDAFGDHVACTNHLCRLVRDLDWSCP